jgi:hypothetical protein
MSKYTREQIEKAVLDKGYKYFYNNDYNLNIVGIRNSTPGRSVTNIFDDHITVAYKVNGAWIYEEWMATTEPGKKAVLQYTNPNGVAILVPGQYRNCYGIRLHAGQYEALGQNKPVKIWRDKNKDMVFDFVDEVTGVFGINIHRSNPTTESTYVENWSEGCQVFKKVKDFNKFMSLCRQSRNIWGNEFTYTLIESKDILSL